MKNYTVLQTIVCDDVRREDNGKEILIGVYNQNMILQSVPALLPTLAIRFLLRAGQNQYDVAGTIVGPDEKEVLKFGGQASFGAIKHLCAFSIKFSPMPITQYGHYMIKLGLGGTELEEVGFFDVITQEEGMFSAAN